MTKPMDLEFVKCNYCGSENSSSFVSGRDFASNEEDGTIFVLNTCNNCGLVYQNPRPHSSSIAKYYPDSYSPYNKKGYFVKIFDNVISSSRKERRCLLNFLQTGNLLDIGCANGIFLNEMQKKGQFEVTGVEFSPIASQKARLDFGLNVITGDLLAANFQGGQFDVVTMWNVLEHVHDPMGTMKEVHRILKPGGFFIIRVPNPQSLAANIFGKFWAGFDLPRHLFIFHKNILVKMAQDAGFSIKRTYFWGYMWPTSVKFWFNGRDKYNGRVGSQIAHLVYRLSQIFLIRLLLFPFWEMVAWVGLGENMTLVFKKQD
jgi:2-polyprenyl-3-methyl-5-hydroxy-6-metoxy-1,4-benzoquinol methylase